MKANVFARRRASYLRLAGATVGLGLASRRYAAQLPGWVGHYAGDALWALLVYWLVSLLRPGWPSGRRALVAGSFALAIETSQLWQAPWLLAVRHTTLGGLVLGQGFLWSDLACYAVGIAGGLALERGQHWARRCRMSASLPAIARATPAGGYAGQGGAGRVAATSEVGGGAAGKARDAADLPD